MGIPLLCVCRVVVRGAGYTRAQSTFGDIVGVVKDPGQGVVAGAKVELKNLDEGTQQNATTNSDGVFHFVNLKPGHYEILVQVSGFADFKVSSAQVDARQSLRLDVALKLASASQSIEVGAESGPAINTENATIGDTKDFQQITALPVNYRGTTTRTNSFLGTVNNFLPPDKDLERNKNLIVSHNYAITDRLVNEARFGYSLYRLQVLFPITGAAAIATLGLQGLDLSDHPHTGGFPIFNFSDDIGNFSPIGRDKDGTTESKTIQFADNLTWIKGKHTMKFGVDIRRVGYVDLESFGSADDFGAFTFNQGVFSFRGAFQRPDCTGNPNVADPATGGMFNINSFPNGGKPSGPVGNCGVGILQGPGTTAVAAGLAKNLHITERMRLRFEGTFTNLFNHPNFAPPPTNVTATSFGQVQSVQNAENSGNRTGQLSLRLDF